MCSVQQRRKHMIDHVEFLLEKQKYLRLYAAPAALLYLLPLYAWLALDVPFIEVVLLILTVATHALTFLATVWSPALKVSQL